MAPTEPSEAPQWLFRGQTHDHPLMTTIERALVGWGIDLEEASAIEFQTMREFRRRLREPEYHLVQQDKL
jgi:hypothetical protein